MSQFDEESVNWVFPQIAPSGILHSNLWIDGLRVYMPYTSSNAQKKEEEDQCVSGELQAWPGTWSEIIRPKLSIFIPWKSELKRRIDLTSFSPLYPVLPAFNRPIHSLYYSDPQKFHTDETRHWTQPPKISEQYSGGVQADFFKSPNLVHHRP